MPLTGEAKLAYMREYNQRPSAKELKAARRAAGGRQRESGSQYWRQLPIRYGITQADYLALLERQQGVCAICSRSPGKKRLAVDHDHEDGTVRGLLCDRCNLAIGSLGDDLGLMEAALDYLHAWFPR